MSASWAPGDGIDSPVLVRAGGHFAAAFQSDGKAQEFQWDAELMLQTQLPGVPFETAIRDWSDGQTYGMGADDKEDDSKETADRPWADARDLLNLPIF